MKKYLVVALIVMCAWIDVSSLNLAKVSYANGKYTFSLSLESSIKNKTTYLELSVYEDFSRIRNVEIVPADKNKGETRSKTVSETAADEGDYYWRIRVSDSETKFSWIYPTSGEANPIHFTGKPKEYVVHQDETEFEEIAFDDGTKLNLSSIWLRSHLLGNHTFVCQDKPGAIMYKTAFTFNHGFFVKDGIIYLCRGSFRTAGWDSDRSRLWLLRYDLATGEELPMLWVYAPDGADYALEEVMPWVRTDDDGTPYFTTFSFREDRTRVVVYSLNLDDVTADAHSIIADEVVSVTRKKGVVPGYISVNGSIKSGEFELWGATENDSFGFGTHDPEWQVVRWKVSGGVGVEELSDIMNLGFITEDLAYENLNMMVYPVGDDCFYLHGYAIGNHDALSPTLYKFNPGAACELLQSYGPEGVYPQMRDPRMGGIAMPVIDGKQLLIYGVPAQGNGEASAARIAYVPSLTGDFADHKILWQPGDATGFSTNLIQGVDAKFIPDEGARTGGIFVLYLGNGALGVYRVDVKSPTVGIDAATLQTITVSYDGENVNLGMKVAGMVLYDAQGRCIAADRSMTDRIYVGRLPKGVYIVSADNNRLNAKLIVY